MLADDFHLVVAALRPAHIHALQHLRPVLALGAAGAGMNLDIGVIGVGLAREQRLDLPGVGLLPQPDERLLGLGDDVVVTLLLAKGDELDMVVELADNAVERAERGLELLALAHQALSAAAVAPEVRGLGLAVERG